MRITRSGFVIAVLACTGCAPFTISKGVCTHRETHVSATLPAGWVVESVDPAVLVTRNGERLQKIAITVKPVDVALAGTERQYRGGMLPNEVAELTLGLIEARPGHAQFEVTALDFDQLAGHDAYRADVTFVDPAGLPKRTRIHGAIIADHVIEFAYEAARAVYYEIDEASFDSLLATVRLDSR